MPKFISNKSNYYTNILATEKSKSQQSLEMLSSFNYRVGKTTIETKRDRGENRKVLIIEK